MAISITSKIEDFAKFLNVSWALVEDIIKGEFEEDTQDDWFQVNWELLVERELGVEIFLEVYGNGADCYGASSRITFNEKAATHFITCKSNNGQPLTDLLSKKQLLNKNNNLIFDRLVTMTDDGWYAESSPFSQVLCRIGGDEVILNLEDLEFSLSEFS